MISTEEYKAIISDLMDELPEEFFRDLTGGVIMSEALVMIHNSSSLEAEDARKKREYLDRHER